MCICIPPAGLAETCNLLLCGHIFVCLFPVQKKRHACALHSATLSFHCMQFPCSLVTAPLLQDLSQEGSDTVLQRCWERLWWWTFIFRTETFQKFLVTLSPLTHSPRLFVFFSSDYFEHQFFFSFPIGSNRITKAQFTVSANPRQFLPLSLRCFGICNLLLPFLFSYKKQYVP